MNMRYFIFLNLAKLEDGGRDDGFQICDDGCG